MSEKNYVIVDIETTGLSKTRDRITEIAAVRFDGQEVVEEWQTLVNPGMRISSFITSLTGIDDTLVADASPIQDVLPAFFDFLGEDVFVAHNASFDKGFLGYNAAVHLEHDWQNQVLCTRKLANRVVSHLPSKSLENLCNHFGVINAQAHRAMADVLATTEIFRGLLEIIDQQHASCSIEDVLHIQKKSVGFGRKLFAPC